MSLILTTETGSVYEVDKEKKAIRRLAGSSPDTRIGSGEWKTYSAITDIVLGNSLCIIWQVVADNDHYQAQEFGAVAKTTITSHIVSIDNCAIA